MSEITYSLVVPVYNNAPSLPLLLLELEKLESELQSKFEAIFVVDGSPDHSYQLLKQQLPHASFPTQLIVHSRNFGSYAAIRTGMEAARGRYIGMMAADMQEPISLALDMFTELASGNTDVAIAQRTGRDDGWCQTLTSNLFWGIYRRLVQRDVPPGGVDVFAVNRQVRDVLLSMKESNSTLVGLLFWVGFRRAFIPYHRVRRMHGKSGWKFRRKFRYMLDSVFAFSDLPIVMMLTFGVLGLAGSIGFSLWVLIQWSMGFITVPGYTVIILLLCAFFALTILSLGILGMYIWRTFENTKKRPSALVMMQESFGQSI